MNSYEISGSFFLLRCVRHLLQFGANPYVENNLGITSWHNLSQLDETIELECLHEFVSHAQNLVTTFFVSSKFSLFVSSISHLLILFSIVLNVIMQILMITYSHLHMSK